MKEQSLIVLNGRAMFAALIIIVGSIMAPTGAQAAIYLELPGIPGDGTAKGYENWIVVDTVEFEFARDVKDSGKGGTQDINLGVAATSPIAWTQSLDRSYPLLFINSISGSALQGNAKFHFVKTGGSKSEGNGESFFRIELERPIIASSSFAGNANDESAVSASLLYKTITVEFDLFDDKGNKSGMIKETWNFVDQTQAASIGGLIQAASLPAAVPLPAAVWLLIPALGILGARRRGPR